MQDWTLTVDHKPLIPILSTKELQLIANPRIANQRVKLLPFCYKPVHIAGKANVIPDVLSRAAQADQAPKEECHLPLQDVLEVRTEYASTYGPPGWVARLAGCQEDGREMEAHIMGLALSQVAATQELEKEVAATHGLGGVRAVT